MSEGTVEGVSVFLFTDVKCGGVSGGYQRMVERESDNMTEGSLEGILAGA